MRVLLAEDDLTTRRVLEAILSRRGYDLVSAWDGEEAWKILQETDAPKVAVLDWMMPGLEGVEVCRKVRLAEASGGTEPTNPVYLILLTTRSSKEDIVVGLEAGANDYIAKPYSEIELCARVEVGRRVVDLQTALERRLRELQDALDHVKTLQGILPICMHCNRIRNDQESWELIERYIEDHSDAQFSHGLCPECLEKHYPEV